MKSPMVKQELDLRWKSYTDFWKIVGKHSQHWNHPKMETILMLQEWFDSELNNLLTAVREAVGEPTHQYCDAMNCEELLSHRKEEAVDKFKKEIRTHIDTISKEYL